MQLCDIHASLNLKPLGTMNVGIHQTLQLRVRCVPHCCQHRLLAPNTCPRRTRRRWRHPCCLCGLSVIQRVQLPQKVLCVRVCTVCAWRARLYTVRQGLSQGQTFGGTVTGRVGGGTIGLVSNGPYE